MPTLEIKKTTKTTKNTTKTTKNIEITELQRAKVIVVIRGTSGLLSNRRTPEAELALMVGGGKNKEDIEDTPKHDMLKEYRDSMHIFPDANKHTSVFMPSVMMKSAMANTALELGRSVTKENVKRLVYFPEDYIPIYGMPRLRYDVVMRSGRGRTADIRTRAFFPEWWSIFPVLYMESRITEGSICALVHNAGQINGIGDYRVGQGRKEYGAFGIETWQGSLRKTVGAANLDKAGQRELIDNPIPLDDAAARMFAKNQEIVAGA